MASKRRRHADAERGSRPDPAGPSEPAPAARADRTIRRYFLLFAAFAVGLFALYRLSEATHTFQHVNDFNAAASAAVLQLAGVATERHGSSLTFQSGGLQIISECSAIYVTILFAAGVLAFPTTWRARAWGLAIGVPGILAINVLRLATLGVVVRYRSSLLPFFHEYLWQVLFVLVVAAFYLAWIDRFAPRRGSAA